MASEPHLQHLKSQRHGRIAPRSPHGQPDVTPVRFPFDGTRFSVVGSDRTHTLKYPTTRGGVPTLASAVDQLEPIQPRTPRGVQLHIVLEIVNTVRRAQLLLMPMRQRLRGVNAPTVGDTDGLMSDQATAPPSQAA